jgi:hypothetical protein
MHLVIIVRAAPHDLVLANALPAYGFTQASND